jgi:hypothetical protein
MREHLSKACNKGQTYRERWIRAVLSAGVKPLHELVERGCGDGWSEREVFWISYYRAHYTLVNTTDGGEGLPGYTPTAELRALWSQQRRGVKYQPGRVSGMLGHRHTEEARSKISDAGRRRVLAPETRAKIGAGNRGKIRTPEQIEAMAATKRGRPLAPEHRAKITASTAKLGRQVLCVETGVIFPSGKAASRELNIGLCLILQAIRKGCRAGGFHFARPSEVAGTQFLLPGLS